MSARSEIFPFCILHVFKTIFEFFISHFFELLFCSISYVGHYLYHYCITNNDVIIFVFTPYCLYASLIADKIISLLLPIFNHICVSNSNHWKRIVFFLLDRFFHFWSRRFQENFDFEQSINS